MQKETDKVDVIGFIDIDFLARSKQDIEEIISYTFEFDTIIGCTFSNSNNASNFISISSFCFFISTSLFKEMGRLSFKTDYIDNLLIKTGPIVLDTGEKIVREAERMGRKTFGFFPTSYFYTKLKNPFDLKKDSIFRLGYYGLFGLGTCFNDRFFHLLESRIVKQNYVEEKISRIEYAIKLFKKVGFNYIEQGTEIKGKYYCSEFANHINTVIVDLFWNQDRQNIGRLSTQEKQILKEPVQREPKFIIV